MFLMTVFPESLGPNSEYNFINLKAKKIFFTDQDDISLLTTPGTASSSPLLISYIVVF